MSLTADPAWTLRLAREEEAPELEELIHLSATHLLPAYYSPAQLAAAIGPVFGLDRQLIRDGTYFAIEAKATGRLIACGGWSKRLAVYGGDRHQAENAGTELQPGEDAARVRAFFIHPHWVRKGLGRALLLASEEGLLAAGFTRAEMVATLAGEPLYAAHGYSVVERIEAPLSGGLTISGVRMAKDFPLAGAAL